MYSHSTRQQIAILFILVLGVVVGTYFDGLCTYILLCTRRFSSRRRLTPCPLRWIKSRVRWREFWTKTCRTLCEASGIIRIARCVCGRGHHSIYTLLHCEGQYAQSQFVLCTSFVLYTFPINSRNFKKVIGLRLGLVLVTTDSIVKICVHVQCTHIAHTVLNVSHTFCML